MRCIIPGAVACRSVTGRGPALGVRGAWPAATPLPRLRSGVREGSCGGGRDGWVWPGPAGARGALPPYLMSYFYALLIYALFISPPVFLSCIVFSLIFYCFIFVHSFMES